MREYLKRESGYIILAIICIALGATAAFRAYSAKSGGSITIADYKPPASALIDINTADAEMLESLPGVGEKLAGRIIAARPFESVDELMDVEGIGEKTLAGFADRITIGRNYASGAEDVPQIAAGG